MLVHPNPGNPLFFLQGCTRNKLKTDLQLETKVGNVITLRFTSRLLWPRGLFSMLYNVTTVTQSGINKSSMMYDDTRQKESGSKTHLWFCGFRVWFCGILAQLSWFIHCLYPWHTGPRQRIKDQSTWSKAADIIGSGAPVDRRDMYEHTHIKTHTGNVPPLSVLFWTVSWRVKLWPENKSVKDTLGITLVLMSRELEILLMKWKEFL